MLTNFLGSVWQHLPGVLRRRMVRLGQSRFTVTTGAFVFDDHGRILLLEHEFRPDSRWGIPGGFLSKGEQPEGGLRRELKEEVNLEVGDVKFMFARTLPRPNQVEIYFACRALNAPVPSSFEIREAQWFATDDLPAELSKDQRKMIESVLRAGEKIRR